VRAFLDVLAEAVANDLVRELAAPHADPAAQAAQRSLATTQTRVDDDRERPPAR
jgi:hypothetical protein